MGPFFALGDALGLPEWVVTGSGSALVLALGAWGVVRLLDALSAPARRWRTWRRAALLLNPYVVVYAGGRRSRCSATRRCRGCCCACTAACATPRGVAVAGGVRARARVDGRRGERGRHRLGAARARCCWSSTSWAAGGAWRGRVRAFAGRSRRSRRRLAVVGRARARAGALRRSTSCPSPSSPGRSGATTSLPESLRLMGYWMSYIGVGYAGTLRAFQADAGVDLFRAGRARRRWLVPALRAGGLRVDAPRALRAVLPAAVLVGLLVMIAASPRARRCAARRRSPTTTSQAVQFLRTTYKAGPLVGARPRGPRRRWRVPRCARRAARRAALVGAARRWSPSRAGRWCAARRRPPARLRRRARRVERRRARPRPHAAATAGARWSCPGSCSPSTTGAGRSTRSCPR